MTTTIIVIALVLAGLALSRTRVVKELNSRRFMPVIYAAATVYFAVRAFGAASDHARVWPHALLAAMFLGGVVESVRASGIFRRS
ncbi:MAG: hypothetical protein PHD74_02995 [Candidatus Krumholzibacteria bacterium]|nr:hypothetical protein [Candidatus Krumholzibacteria bacterium]